MKVWVVTHGEYSDYQIDAIFSTEEKARAYSGAFDSVEEYELDAPSEEFGQLLYSAALNLINGSENDSWSSLKYGANPAYKPANWSGAIIYEQYPGIALGRSVISHDHAMKIAVEARQKWLREKDIRSAEGKCQQA